MHNPQQVAKVLFATNVVTYISVVILLREIKKQTARYNKLFNMTLYMGTLLENSDVHLDEFDIIALGEMGVTFTEIEDEVD